jgi:AcrR family transcriptional regulator
VLRNSPAPSSSTSRDARALRTGEALRRAMIALLERKPLEDITIREIAAEAGVNYATFFRHHATKEALLLHVAADQMDMLIALAVPVLDRAGGLAGVTALLDYIDEHRRMWSALVTGGASERLREELLRLAFGLAEDRAPLLAWPPITLAVNYSAGLIYETLAWWVLNPSDPTAKKQLARTLDHLLSQISIAGSEGIGN